MPRVTPFTLSPALQAAFKHLPNYQIQIDAPLAKLIVGSDALKHLNVDAINHLLAGKKNLSTKSPRAFTKAHSAEMSTGQKVVAGSIAAAVGGALGFVAYKVYKSGDQ